MVLSAKVRAPAAQIGFLPLPRFLKVPAQMPSDDCLMAVCGKPVDAHAKMPMLHDV
jgi:hypothetical protein